ncbi:TPA: hypothetical protein HA249_07355 [Candidatus Woesearchaeota archaeon]|nr:MAG: hypothetical protein QT07_C0007G0026 [archaeon GW2011_AR16]HIG96668.1 hypothetical protein [Candidatus Woesearchaeota archaeon]HIH46942.1 hypothetical protein [Candidatus Woesearchaeota archaeon]HII89123.1 hypothetical protein [Candidatus Woesearchaeota archaeon]
MIQKQMLKKAQGISINVIVIAALALLVLVVLAMIFTGKLGGWTKAQNECSSNGGMCVGDASQCTGENAQVMSRYTCPNAGEVCCLTLEGVQEPTFETA